MLGLLEFNGLRNLAGSGFVLCLLARADKSPTLNDTIVRQARVNRRIGGGWDCPARPREASKGTDMRASLKSNLALTGLLIFTGAGLTACQAERAVVSSAEPTWSYHDGDSRLSNNDAWTKMLPTATVSLPFFEAKVASVEDPTK